MYIFFDVYIYVYIFMVPFTKIGMKDFSLGGVNLLLEMVDPPTAKELKGDVFIYLYIYYAHVYIYLIRRISIYVYIHISSLEMVDPSTTTALKGTHIYM
jgi:hypothetical protein